MNKLTVNVTTGESIIEAMTDAEILNLHQPQIQITIANTSKLVGESEVVSIQLVTPPLSDDSRNNVAQSETVKMQFGDVIQDVVLDGNGAWSDTMDFVDTGLYTIKSLTHSSNEIIVEVS